MSTKPYRPLDTSGNNYADMVGMSELDKAALAAAKQSWEAANAAGDEAGKAAAHRQGETIRAQYGYSGGVDGTQYLPTGQAKQSPPTGQTQRFTYQSAPQYVNKYQAQLDDLTKQILGREAFSYDAEKDPLYQQYEASYTRNGQKAMEDTLGQVSARTGGLASSYAATAAQQAYDGYMSALNDKIPELRQLAYSMYMDEGDRLRSDLAMLQGREQDDYAKFLGEQGQYNTDRSFHYGLFNDQRSYDYQTARDALNDRRYDSEVDYSKAADKAATLAASGDFSGYKALGYTDKEIAGMKAAYDREQAAAMLKARSGGGSGSRGGGSSSTGKPALSYSQAKALYDDGVRTEKVLSAMEYYVGDIGGEGTGQRTESYGPAKMSGIARNMAKFASMSGMGGAKWAEEVEKALDDGSMTEAEANELLKLYGYGA